MEEILHNPTCIKPCNWINYLSTGAGFLPLTVVAMIDTDDAMICTMIFGGLHTFPPRWSLFFKKGKPTRVERNMQSQSFGPGWYLLNWSQFTKNTYSIFASNRYLKWITKNTSKSILLNLDWWIKQNFLDISDILKGGIWMNSGKYFQGDLLFHTSHIHSSKTSKDRNLTHVMCPDEMEASVIYRKTYCWLLGNTSLSLSLSLCIYVYVYMYLYIYIICTFILNDECI